MQKGLKKIVAFVMLLNLMGAQITTAAQPSGKNTDSYEVNIVKPNAINSNKILLELKPGDSSEGALYVKNTSDVEMSFSFYATDSFTNDDGSLHYKSKHEPQELIGKWIIFEEKKMELKPSEGITVNYTVTIPEDTDLQTYKGGVTAEKAPQKIVTSGINKYTRVVRQVEIKVTDDPQPIPLLPIPEPEYVPTPFFWGTLGVFLASMAYLFYANKKEKKQKGKK